MTFNTMYFNGLTEEAILAETRKEVLMEWRTELEAARLGLKAIAQTKGLSGGQQRVYAAVRGLRKLCNQKIAEFNQRQKDQNFDAAKLALAFMEVAERELPPEEYQWLLAMAEDEMHETINSRCLFAS